ncbi:MAG: DUF2283 domain-containing protein [Candidatus Levybacteria bacterium]|nr:DUF2283 domain-containing protein [Candidatus Levybacteria bacterium]
MNKQEYRFTYEKEDDILNIWLSDEAFDYADQTGDVIIHFTRDGRPVYIKFPQEAIKSPP